MAAAANTTTTPGKTGSNKKTSAPDQMSLLIEVDALPAPTGEVSSALETPAQQASATSADPLRTREELRRAGRPRGGPAKFSELELLAGIAPFQVVTVSQVARLFGQDIEWAYKRVRGLVSAGFVQEATPAGFRGKVLWLTGRSLKRLDLESRRTPTLGAALSHHAASVEAFLAIARALRGTGLKVIGEMEVRRNEGFRVMLDGGSVSTAWQCPDLVVVGGSNGPVAVEVELTRKSGARLDSILSAYGSPECPFSGVVYLVPTAELNTAIEQHASLIGAQGSVRAVVWPWEVNRDVPLSPGVFSPFAKRVLTPTASAPAVGVPVKEWAAKADERMRRVEAFEAGADRADIA